jgi:5-methylcytosine-specific restriction enzyme subunit McrC
MGLEVIAGWLEGALNLVAVPETAERQPSESFIALLLAAVWSRGLDQASRHGPPAFRREHRHEGIYVRGRLDVRESARLRGQGSPHVASVSRYRDLNNDVSRTLVAAERVLHQAVGHRRWHTQRVDDVLQQLL